MTAGDMNDMACFYITCYYRTFWNLKFGPDWPIGTSTPSGDSPVILFVTFLIARCLEVPPVSISELLRQCVEQSDGKLSYSLLQEHQLARAEGDAPAPDLLDEFCFKYCVLDKRAGSG